MSVTSGFFNSLSGDRKYDAIQISSMFDGLITDGIYNGFLESFMVTASSPASMVVTVGEGRCWFNHTWTLNDAPLPLTLDVGDVVLNRIDTIVIDVDSTDTVRACTIKVVKGTPSSQAVAPSLENTETHHQYPLCDISVPAGATTITQSNITNRRGTSDCPFVATLMKSVNVDDLLIQWESQWNDWMTDRANSMDSWTAEQQEAFTTWFQTVQDILDENTAGNLLNRINHRTGINATATYSEGVVAITAPDDAGEILTFVAPSDFLSSDTYTLNGEALTITDLNGEALDDSWKKNSPITITVSGGKAFFKAGGSGKNDTLPPLLGNMTVEVVEGEETDTYTIKMDKLVLDKTTEMVGGAQLEWGEEMPAKPGKGTGGIKTWTREEVITTSKPYDGLYLGDVTPSDAVTETLIYLPENKDGKTVLEPFVILSTDYLGGVYLMRKYLWMLSTYAGKYPQSNINTLLLSGYKTGVLASDISAQVMVVPLPVYGESGDIYETDFFVPSMAELNFGTGGDIPTEGTMMPYFSSVQRRYAYVSQEGEKSGAKQEYWSRTGSISTSTSKYYVNTNGGKSTSGSTSTQWYIRPCFILPKDFKIQKRPDGSYTVWNEQGLMTLGDLEASTDVIETTVNAAEMYPALENLVQTFVPEIPEIPPTPEETDYVTHTIEVPHGQKVVFRQFTQNQKKQFQTMLVGGVYPPLGDVEPPFKLPEFTGNHAIFGDETSGRIELYESGTLTLYPGTYDLFAVGGGGGGGSKKTGASRGGGGGGGGYTNTVSQYTVDNATTFAVIVGAGGGARGAGSVSSVSSPTGVVIATANGGGAASTAGGAGGSGGGAGGKANRGGNGGSDGANGFSYSGMSGGTGQGSTTRLFEEPEATLYSGGGGGGYYAATSSSGNASGLGGSGGGGNGALDRSTNARTGTANTGGGGGGGGGGSSTTVNPAGGGSGIIIIRWNNT